MFRPNFILILVENIITVVTCKVIVKWTTTDKVAVMHKLRKKVLPFAT